MKKDKWLVLRVDVDWLEGLKRIAKLEGVTCSELVRRVIEERYDLGSVLDVKCDLTDWERMIPG